MSTGGVVEVTLRTAVEADLPELRRSYRDASLSNPGDAPSLLANPKFLRFGAEGVLAGCTRVAVAGADGSGPILGFATVAGDQREPEMDDLFVDPGWQRQGIGRLLVEDAVESVGRRGSTRLWVTGNPHAAQFYAAVGFVGGEQVPTGVGVGLRLHLDIR